MKKSGIIKWRRKTDTTKHQMHNDKTFTGMGFDWQIVNGPNGIPHNQMDNQIFQRYHDFVRLYPP